MIWIGLLEQIMYQLAPKGRQRISQHDVYDTSAFCHNGNTLTR